MKAVEQDMPKRVVATVFGVPRFTLQDESTVWFPLGSRLGRLNVFRTVEQNDIVE